MRVRLLSSIVVSVLALAACTVTNSEVPGGASSGGSSSGGSSSGGSSSGGSSSGGSSSGNVDKPPAATTAANIDIDGTCPAFTPCGGNPQGTYDYTSGCIEDVFAQLRQSCSGLDTSGANVTVTGSIYFLGNALHRNATTKISGSIVFPATCTAGQCSLVQAQLQGAFDSVTCSGASSCTCVISDTTKTEDGTTYTISGSTVTTASGDQYQICENGSDLAYKGAGGGSEEGSFQLRKR